MLLRRCSRQPTRSQDQRRLSFWASWLDPGVRTQLLKVLNTEIQNFNCFGSVVFVILVAVANKYLSHPPSTLVLQLQCSFTRQGILNGKQNHTTADSQREMLV